MKQEDVEDGGLSMREGRQAQANKNKDERRFPFPFPPYAIQRQFMNEMYAVLDKGGLGIFESPTGTGKSLSIICSALQWLRDNENNLDLDDAAALDDKPTALQPTDTADKTNKKEEAAASATTASATPELDWITAAYQKMQEKKRALELEEQKEKRLKQQKRLEKLQEAEPDHPNKKRKVAWLSGGKGAGGKAHQQQKPDLSFIDEMIRRSEEKEKRKQEGEGDGDGTHSDDEFCLAEYESEDEDERPPPDVTATSRGGKDKKGHKSKREMLKGLYLDSQEDDEADGEGEEELHVRKLYYCSRTHSQLRQFVGEVKRTEFADRMRVVTLGSRKNLCVNAKVKKLSSVGAINDRCLDMQKQKTLVTEEENMFGKAKKSVVLSKCEWYEQSSQKLYRDHVLLKVRDIEELVQLGEKQRACPYYGTRAAVPSVEVVALPYNMLLHRATRESLGVDLKGNIVVVDEAHNLVDAINEMYSTQLTLRQLTQAESQLDQYRARYQNRLKAKNLSYIRQILVIVRAFIKLLQNPHAWPASASAGAAGAAVAATSSSLALPTFTHHATQESEEKTQISTSNDFLFATKIDNMNLFKIEKYIQRSEIVKKLNGFVEKYESSEVQVHISDDGEEIEVEGRSRPAMGAVEAFLLSLTNADADGRLLLSHNPRKVGESSLKFILLNPAKHFREVVAEARAVVLAGGTMHPIPDLVFQLFGPEAEVPEPIKPKLVGLRSFSCGHVITSESLLTLCVGSGPSDVPFDFAWQNRSSAAMIEELGRLVLNMCNLVPDGVVMFFPSYHYEQQVISTWETSGMLAKINARKKVLREPRAASMIGQVLEEYKDAIDANFTPTGAAASTSRQRGAILSAVVGGKMSEGINFSDGLGRCVVMVGLPYPNPRDPVLVEKMKYISAKAAAAAASTSSSSSSSSSWSSSSSPARRAMSAPVMSARQYYENACMRAVNQSIGRSIRHAGDYATILLVDHRYMRPEITSKLPRWIAATMPPNGADPSKPFTFGQAFGHTRAFFQNKRERQAAIENQRRSAREGNNHCPNK